MSDFAHEHGGFLKSGSQMYIKLVKCAHNTGSNFVKCFDEGLFKNCNKDYKSVHMYVATVSP